MTFRWLTMCAVAALSLPAHAADDWPVHRNRDGTINYAPRPAAFVVVEVDTWQRLVRLRGPDGATTDVRVPEGAHDLDALKPGDIVRVDFLVPNVVSDAPPNEEAAAAPTAAALWPVR